MSEIRQTFRWKTCAMCWETKVCRAVLPPEPLPSEAFYSLVYDGYPVFSTDPIYLCADCDEDAAEPRHDFKGHNGEPSDHYYTVGVGVTAPGHLALELQRGIQELDRSPSPTIEGARGEDLTLDHLP